MTPALLAAIKAELGPMTSEAKAKRVAKAVLGAIREPTQEQELAYVNATVNQWATMEGLRIGYCAMISALLAQLDGEENA